MDFGEQKDPKADDAVFRGNILRGVTEMYRRDVPPDAESLRIAVVTALDLALGGNGTEGSLKTMIAFPPEGIEPGEGFLLFAAAINKRGAFDFVASVPVEPERPKTIEGVLESTLEAAKMLAEKAPGSVTYDFFPQVQCYGIITTDPELAEYLRQALAVRSTAKGSPGGA